MCRLGQTSFWMMRDRAELSGRFLVRAELSLRCRIKDRVQQDWPAEVCACNPMPMCCTLGAPGACIVFPGVRNSHAPETRPKSRAKQLLALEWFAVCRETSHAGRTNVKYAARLRCAWVLLVETSVAEGAKRGTLLRVYLGSSLPTQTRPFGKCTLALSPRLVYCACRPCVASKITDGSFGISTDRLCACERQPVGREGVSDGVECHVAASMIIAKGLVLSLLSFFFFFFSLF